MQITDILSESTVVPTLKGETKQHVLQELVESLAGQHQDIDTGSLLDALWQRERLGSTGIAQGVAVPHAKLPNLSRMLCVFGRHPQGVNFESLDGLPTKLFFLLVAPEEAVGQHLKALAQVSRLVRDAAFRERLMHDGDQHELYGRIAEQEARA